MLLTASDVLLSSGFYSGQVGQSVNCCASTVSWICCCCCLQLNSA